MNEYVWFAQDSFRATGRLTLSYGVRFDYFQYAQPPVKNSDPALAALGLDTSRINADTNNFAPRFRFACKLTNSDNTVIRGRYGMFYGRTPELLTGTAFSQNGVQVQTYTLNQTTGGIPTYPSVLAAPPALSRRTDILTFAPNYVQPLTQRWSFNIDQQLGSNWAVTLGYLSVRGVDLLRTRDINLFEPKPVQRSLTGGNALTVLRYSSTRTFANFGRIQISDSGADSIHHGGLVQLTNRFSRGFLVQSSYTFSKSIDDNPDFTAVVVGTADAKMAQSSSCRADVPYSIGPTKSQLRRRGCTFCVRDSYR